MEIDPLPGYWAEGCGGNRIQIGFLYGGHMGGECEIYLPKKKLAKFTEDDAWRKETKNRFYRIVYLASPDLNVPIPETEAIRDGMVPDNWE